MKLPKSAHFSRPWRIHGLTRDFRLEDVWELPTPGGPHDFRRLVQMVASFDEARPRWSLVGALFAVRAGARSGLRLGRSRGRPRASEPARPPARGPAQLPLNRETGNGVHAALPD